MKTAARDFTRTSACPFLPILQDASLASVRLVPSGTIVGLNMVLHAESHGQGKEYSEEEDKKARAVFQEMKNEKLKVKDEDVELNPGAALDLIRDIIRPLAVPRIYNVGPLIGKLIDTELAVPKAASSVKYLEATLKKPIPRFPRRTTKDTAS
ncbi:hypothetical protein D9758_004585 [Tetrapyrgos nigripes]|uniref:Uncharacterized protein n=1 Tax=Tetrapyrgos nigripes TaxID=182062 RepID=A0A8H5LYR1_9AGAR|nr:hypothetical protein D9758_004585 [Tetrapyrgos nigripes]